MSTVTNFMHWEDPGTAFVTGASSGIGAAFARQLAKQGFEIILVARRREKMDALEAELQSQFSAKTEVVPADLTRSADIDRVADKVSEQENLDVLINNAGFGTIGYFAEADFSRQTELIQVHVSAPVHLCRAALPSMIKRGRGAIINVSSIGAFLLGPGNVTYNATKAFLKVFSENMRFELEGTGVKVQALCPGFTITEFHEVGDFKNFDRTLIPKELWMTAEDVVSQSLEAFRKNNAVFIPGAKTRLFAWLYRNTFIGTVSRRKLRNLRKGG